MVSDELKREAANAWKAFGDVVVKAFSFPSGSMVDATLLENILNSADDDQIRKFIRYCKKQAKELADEKYMGE